MMPDEKDYRTISPSAKSLLLLKGSTNIPFAKEVAALMVYPEAYDLSPANRSFSFWARVIHFENRYWSIDQLLNETAAMNILELSSGYSFRGLDMAHRKPVYYIDTDLEEVISLKRKFVASLEKDGPKPTGRLEVLPLNALDERQFNETVARFPEGPVVIVNEGLLMYLDNEEKLRLSTLIHRTLQQRGGCWITADIYVKRKENGLRIEQTANEKEFFKQHRIEENKFDSFEAAGIFFNEAGFEKVMEARADHSRLSALPHLIATASVEQAEKMEKTGRIQATWMLKPFETRNPV
jgi:O-methyltransferase involved in polyketide biosynthesis